MATPTTIDLNNSISTEISNPQWAKWSEDSSGAILSSSGVDHNFDNNKITGCALTGAGWGSYLGEVWLGQKINTEGDGEKAGGVEFDVEISGYIISIGSGSASAEISGVIENLDDGSTKSESIAEWSGSRIGIGGPPGGKKSYQESIDYEWDAEDSYKVWVKLQVGASVQGAGENSSDFGYQDLDGGEYVKVNSIQINK